MKKSLFVFLLISLCLFTFSCRDDFNFEKASQPLRFSSDTIMLDTVFSSIRTETYALKIYNRQNTDVIIPRIYLEKFQNSQFKINVDGTPGYDFKDVPLRAKDSLYILIEMAPKSLGAAGFLAEEDLIFNTIGNIQKVKLLSLVEDADLFYSKTGTKIISEDMVWDNTKSKIIYGDLKFVNGSTLTILEGTRVYFHKKASLTIEEEGGLFIKGSLGKEVILRGDRHTERYDSLPGSWKQILLAPKTTSDINYALIKGGNNALVVDNLAKLTISNSKIFNFMNSGIHSIGGDIKGSNLVINNCGTADLLLEYGGVYDFTHCSFANYWALNGAAYSVYMSNYYEQPRRVETNSLNAIFKNCIIWTQNRNSISLNKNTASSFVYTFDNNIIKNEKDLFNINDNPNFVNNIINKDPLFNNVNFSKNLLNLKPDSPAFGKANVVYAGMYPLDINGENRESNPTIGAYQN